MAKYFIHNDEQELTMSSPYHNLLGNVPSGWTVVDYQNEGDQADVSDAMCYEDSTFFRKTKKTGLKHNAAKPEIL